MARPSVQSFTVVGKRAKRASPVMWFMKQLTQSRSAWLISWVFCKRRNPLNQIMIFQPTVDWADRHPLDHLASNLKDATQSLSPLASQNNPQQVGYTVNRPVNQSINPAIIFCTRYVCTLNMCAAVQYDPDELANKQGYPRLLWIYCLVLSTFQHPQECITQAHSLPSGYKVISYDNILLLLSCRVYRPGHSACLGRDPHS